jgi:hypothetical protein
LPEKALVMKARFLAPLVVVVGEPPPQAANITTAARAGMRAATRVRRSPNETVLFDMRAVDR